MEQTTEKFEAHAIVEIMGHTKLAGMCKTVPFGSTVMLRVDIPETTQHPSHTKMYGMSSVFSITPVDEKTALAHAESWQVQPILAYDVKASFQKQFNAAVDAKVTKKLNQLEGKSNEENEIEYDEDGFPTKW